MEQPFARVRYIPSADELIDLAFRRASKVSPSLPKRAGGKVKVRIKERSRISTAGRILSSRLQRIVQEMPDLDRIHPFYRELADVLVGVGELKRCLGAMKWASEMVQRLSERYARRERYARSIGEAAQLRREAYGRMASIVKQVSDELEFLRNARSQLVKLPSIDPNLPTIVVAGYTNVGKSTLVKAVSSAKPAVASYPFTTKSIIVGHTKTPTGVVQVIDTPGLLDRPLSQRNRIELQAILALKHLAKAIIFLFDPSTTCGYPLENQINLYLEVKRSFSDIPIIPAANKVDIVDDDDLKALGSAVHEPIMKVSALKGFGVREVFEEALSRMRLGG